MSWAVPASTWTRLPTRLPSGLPPRVPSSLEVKLGRREGRAEGRHEGRRTRATARTDWPRPPPPPGDRNGDCAPGVRPDPAPPTTWVVGSGLIQVVRRKRGGEEWRPGPVSWGSRRRERKGKEEVRESIRSRSDGAVEVLVMGEKRKRVTARRGLPKAGSLVERKALFGAEEHQHQQRGVVRRAMRKAVVTFEEGREVKRRGCDGNG